MPKILKAYIAAMLAAGLGGCVGTAGISTWEYRSGPGYEDARVRESRIQADSAQGLTHETCTSVSQRRIAASGQAIGTDLTACDSN